MTCSSPSRRSAARGDGAGPHGRLRCAAPGILQQHDSQQRALGNAFGILIAGRSNSNVVSRNDSHDNRRYGTLNRGNAGTLIRGNEVEHNVVSSLGPRRGISVEGSTNVTVLNNQASDNTPDLFWDGSGSNSFKNSECDTSQPPGLCESKDLGVRLTECGVAVTMGGRGGRPGEVHAAAALSSDHGLVLDTAASVASR